jgi:uncharacterized membrane protein YjgN (DUF898 family)
MHDSIPDTDKAQLKQSTELGNIKLRLEFTGSGSEYFRIWIVNLLLTLVTLGLYYPWAKVRRLRYFYGNTQLDGDPLDFHGDPRKMAKGYLLMGILFGLYSLAAEFSPSARFVALLIVVAVSPALLKSSLQFRLANTSWRGLRFRFKGTLRGAYAATVPLFVPGVLLFGLVMATPNPAQPPQWIGMAAAVIILGTVAMLPWILWNLKNYQHMHYALGNLQTQFKATPSNFYRLFFKIIGFAVLAIVVPMVALGFFSNSFPSKTMGAGNTGAAVTMIAAALGIVVGMVAVFVCIKPYAISRLQNLVWTQTGNRSMRFVSKLRFRGLLWLTLQNWLLIVLTLGLYWPFAAVAMARMRVQAICLKTRIDPNTLVGTVRAAEGDAAGDAAGDFFGFDIGL